MSETILVIDDQADIRALLAMALKEAGYRVVEADSGPAGIAAYHFVLIRKRSREGCFRAFNHNNWFGGAVFVGLLLEYWVP